MTWPECMVCLDTGTERRPNGGEYESWPDTGRPCWICATPHPRSAPALLCLYCPGIATERSVRTREPLCPRCGRMERGEDEYADRWERAEEWARRLGLTEVA